MGSFREFFRDAVMFDIAYSSRKIKKSLNNIEDSVKETNQRLEQLRNDINRHLTNINTELVLQSKILSNINNVLQNKRKTEAEELKKFGIFALQNNWLNEAEEDLFESLKFNKYDYQVYFLLSKIYGNKLENDKQVDYLNKSLKYSVEDSEFQQFIYMDMVSICISNDDFETAEILLSKTIKIKKSTAACLTSVMVDIKKNNISDTTFKNIEDAIDLYDSESPARVIDAVDAISTMVNQENKIKIQNLINKSKYKVIKQYTSISYQKINNLVDLLNQISKDENFIVNIVPQPMIQKYCSNFSGINQNINKLNELRELLKNISIDSYEYIVQLPVFYSYIALELILYYRLVLDFQQEGNILTNPFTQKFSPEFKISGLDSNDTILAQVRLESGNFITLTTQKFIISKSSGLSTILTIEDIDNMELEIINTRESLVQRQQTFKVDAASSYIDIITFLIKKKDTEQILLIDKSSYFSWDYGTNQKRANILNLLWSLAQNNSRIVASMKGINGMLDFTTSITDSYTGFFKSNQISANKSADDEVEFVE
jgi:tetratricopeptide (TPR) repeat protein